MVDLGLDTDIEAVENAPNAGAAYDALVRLFKRFTDSANPFGQAATLTSVPSSVPVGLITKWCGAADSVPDGWLKCEGQSVSATAHAALFAKIGHTFGGSGSTFKLPDYRRRTSIGAGGERPTGSAGPGATLASTGGAETATITEGQMARHSHGLAVTLATEQWHHRHLTSYYFERRTSSPEFVVRSMSATAGPWTDLDDAGDHAHDLTGHSGYAGSGEAVPLASKTVVMTHIIKR